MSRCETRTVRDGIRAAGDIRIAVHDEAICRYYIPWWDALDSAERYRELSSSRPPVSEEYTSNVTCVGLDEAIVDHIDAGQGSAAVVSNLGIGNDDSTSPSHSDTTLNNEVGQVDLTETDDRGSTLFCAWFVDTSELNGNTFKEVGAYDSENRLWNHSLISHVDKDNTITVTIEIELSFTNS